MFVNRDKKLIISSQSTHADSGFTTTGKREGNIENVNDLALLSHTRDRARHADASPSAVLFLSPLS